MECTVTCIGDAIAEHTVSVPPPTALRAATLGTWAGCGALLAAVVFADSRLSAVALCGLLAVAVVLTLVLSQVVTEESLLVMDDFGVQTRTTHFLSGRQTGRFVDRQKIRGVIINEGFTRWQVVFYLAFLLEGGEQDMVVGYPTLRPPLRVLREVYKSVTAGPLGALAQEEAVLRASKR